MASVSFTPQFIEYCKQYYKLSPLRCEYNEAAAQKILEAIDTRCTQFELEYIQAFYQTEKNKLDEHNKKLLVFNAVLTEKETQDRDLYQAFFKNLEEKIANRLNQLAKNPNSSSAPKHSSYQVAPLSGQSYYDAQIYLLGHDAMTLNSSAMFFLLFSALKFMALSPYLEQLAEYHQSDYDKRFDPNNLTDEQIKQNLDKNSTRDEIIQAGFLPEPSLPHGFDIEFQSFQQKMWGMAKEQMNAQQPSNLLGNRLAKSK